MNVLLALQGLDLIKEALNNWGYEDAQGFLCYVQGITDLVDGYSKEFVQETSIENLDN